MNEKKTTYVKCYLNLCSMFDPQEIIFILHMVNINYLRSGGYNTVWSKSFLMRRMNVGLRVFDRCVKRMTDLGLLERKLKNGMYDYCWNMNVYNRLLKIASATNDLNTLDKFGKRVFVKEKRDILSITDDEIRELEEESKYSHSLANSLQM